MANCPKCEIALDTIRQRDGVYYDCHECHGRAATIPQIRKLTGDKFASGLVRKMNHATELSLRACPFCLDTMKLVQLYEPEVTLHSCKRCTAIWFDPGSFELLPEGIIDNPDNLLLSAAEAEAKWKMQERSRLDDGPDEPDAQWKIIPAFIGLPVKFEGHETSDRPWATWGLSAIIAIISFCAFPHLEDAVEKFGMIPAECWRYGGLTLLTSFFLHAGFMHLFGNLYFFLLFGTNVEDHLGRRRFLALIFLSTIVGDIFHIMLEPNSVIPCIGASGGISGVLVFYALQFPGKKLGFFSWRFGWIRIPAWAAFIVWLLLQLLNLSLQKAHLTHVSSMSHLGGVTTGFVLWLLWRKLKRLGTQAIE